MIRYEPPYNGKRFLINLNTGEIHDLTKELSICQIDDIKDFIMGHSYEECEIAGIFRNAETPINGCHYCSISRDID